MIVVLVLPCFKKTEKSLFINIKAMKKSPLFILSLFLLAITSIPLQAQTLEMSMVPDSKVSLGS